MAYCQAKNIGWESGRQKRASHNLPELKESLQLKWHDMEGRWPSDADIPGFQETCEVSALPLGKEPPHMQGSRYLHHFWEL